MPHNYGTASAKLQSTSIIVNKVRMVCIWSKMGERIRERKNKGVKVGKKSILSYYKATSK